MAGSPPPAGLHPAPGRLHDRRRGGASRPGDLGVDGPLPRGSRGGGGGGHAVRIAVGRPLGYDGCLRRREVEWTLWQGARRGLAGDGTDERRGRGRTPHPGARYGVPRCAAWEATCCGRSSVQRARPTGSESCGGGRHCRAPSAGEGGTVGVGRLNVRSVPVTGTRVLPTALCRSARPVPRDAAPLLLRRRGLCDSAKGLAGASGGALARAAPQRRGRGDPGTRDRSN